ncbi:signal recognition particle protein-like [Ylistrum balloti]|uniref:signal recognition particle protein-like n=1 Tax=Ylistrum balloti TaxID=509963 RepID=UPI002905965F|nr:signal recognition particle protein-like [Ylistrum balloti]
MNKAVEQALGEKVLKSLQPGQYFVKILQNLLVQFLGGNNVPIHLKGNPAIILMCGLQGSGKTTTSAKLALRFKEENKRCALLALDTTRAAAVEQLEQLGESISVPIISPQTLGMDMHADKTVIVEKAVLYVKTMGKDLLIIDTAGRSELDTQLLQELKNIDRVVRSCAKILVLDAMTGQSAVELAKNFHETLDITGLVFTKLDSDARGGALLSVKTVADLPVHYVSSGENLHSLEVFHPERIASRILGMGDVLSLVEKVEKQVTQEQAEILHKKIMKKTFTLQDYLEQMQQITSMGSIEDIAAMLPGVSTAQLKNIDQTQIKREEAIILSMTKKERFNPKILGFSRRSRVAKGSGTTVAKVNSLLKKFEKTRIEMKKNLKKTTKTQGLHQNINETLQTFQ